MGCGAAGAAHELCCDGPWTTSVKRMREARLDLALLLLRCWRLANSRFTDRRSSPSSAGVVWRFHSLGRLGLYST
eukprot:120236-Prymnesium_polylepis.1